MEYVKLLDTNIDHERLHDDVKQLILEHELDGHQQISLTSLTGNDDWDCSTGKIEFLQHPEKYYSSINKSIKDTYLAECIKRYRNFFRWRLLRMPSMYTYSIHYDQVYPDTDNVRLHIPIVTNPDCYMVFFDNDDIKQGHFKHLDAGSSYETNTTRLHTATNYGDTERIHLVGVRHIQINK